MDATEKQLAEIKTLLIQINEREENIETSLKEDEIYNKVKNRSEEAINKLQFTFDRIHDKLFNLNNILIGSFLVLATFPNTSPVINLWWISLPVFNLLFFIYIEKRQMEIYRLETKELKWKDEERKKHGKMIMSQNLISLLSIVLTFSALIVLIINIYTSNI